MENRQGRSFLLRNIFCHKLVRGSFLYMLAKGLNAAIPFLFLPILTHYLSPADYGIISTFEILLPIFIIFIGFNSQGLLTVKFFKLDQAELRVFFGNIFFIVLCGLIFLFGALFFLKGLIAERLHVPEPWVLAGIFAAASNFIFLLVLNLWQIEERPLTYSIFLIVQSLLNICLSIIFVVCLKWSWQGRILGILTSFLISAGISLVILSRRSYLCLSFQSKYIKDIFIFGLPLIPHALGGWILTAIDRIFINSMIGTASTGLYTVGYQIGAILMILMASFNGAWVPFLFRNLKKENPQINLRIVKFTYLSFIGIFGVAVLITYLAPFFLKVFVDPSFYSAREYVVWIALASVANGMYYMVANYIFYVEKTMFLAGVTIVSAIMNVFLNYIFIIRNGPVGAAQATAISAFIQFILTWILSMKAYKMPWFYFLRKQAYE